MFATITFVNQNKNNIKSYKIEHKTIINTKYLCITCFKKQAIKKIEKKIYKTVKNIVVESDLKEIRFKKLNVINSSVQTSNTMKDAFEKILNIQKFSFVCVNDIQLKNKEFVKSIINKCELVNIVTDNIAEFYDFSAEIYAEYGVLLLLNNKSFNEQIGVDLDEKYIWFLKSQRKYYVRRGSERFNQEIIKHIQSGINTDEFVYALSQENEFDTSELTQETVLEKNNIFYQINAQNIKKFLDN